MSGCERKVEKPEDCITECNNFDEICGPSGSCTEDFLRGIGAIARASSESKIKARTHPLESGSFTSIRQNPQELGSIISARLNPNGDING